MPTLTPIPLSVEERQRLGSIKHRLEANSWREMLMKLCDIYEDYCQIKSDTPLAKEGIVTENPASKSNVSKPVDERSKEETQPEKEGALTKLLKGLRKEGKEEMTPTDEEKVRQIVREELRNWTIELPEHNHEQKEQLFKDKCEGCGTQFTYTKNKRPTYCPECEGEFDWEED